MIPYCSAVSQIAGHLITTSVTIAAVSHGLSPYIEDPLPSLFSWCRTSILYTHLLSQPNHQVRIVNIMSHRTVTQVEYPLVLRLGISCTRNPQQREYVYMSYDIGDDLCIKSGRRCLLPSLIIITSIQNPTTLYLNIYQSLFQNEVLYRFHHAPRPRHRRHALVQRQSQHR